METELNLGLSGEPADVRAAFASVAAEDSRELLGRIVLDRRSAFCGFGLQMFERQLSGVLERFPCEQQRM